jgi:hypothetical protein
MIYGLHIEVLLALAYAVFLAAVAFLLEVIGRKSHRRADGYRHSGFIYFRDLDYFECPAGHQLVQLQTDHNRRITSYRAAASACNSCSLKINCTDSDGGRMVERGLDTWIESEIRRFHRAISIALLVLAIVLLSAEYFRYSAPYDRNVVAVLLLPLTLAQLKLLSSLR